MSTRWAKNYCRELLPMISAWVGWPGGARCGYWCSDEQDAGL